MNMLHKSIRISGYVLAAGLAAAVLGFTGVMATKILPYLSFERAIHFLGTKPDEVLDKRHFMIAFYVHITSSLVVMLLGVGQFFPWLTRRYRAFHRLSGRMYAIGILLLAAPSGLVLAAYANGGLPSQVGFSLQCIVWWSVTLAGWYEIRQKRYVAHANMMIRSYAVTLAAMSLRTESYAMYYWFGTKPLETYLTVTWLSWVGNLLLAELLIYAEIGKKWVASVLKR